MVLGARLADRLLIGEAVESFERITVTRRTRTHVAHRPHAVELLGELHLATFVEEREPPLAQQHHETAKVEGGAEDGEPLLRHCDLPRHPEMARRASDPPLAVSVRLHNKAVDLKLLERAANPGRRGLGAEAAVARAEEDLVAAFHLARMRDVAGKQGARALARPHQLALGLIPSLECAD